VVDERRLDRRIGGGCIRGAGCGDRRGGHGERFEKRAAADLAFGELVELGCDETFHCGSPSLSA